jgi:hypothetical protein
MPESSSRSHNQPVEGPMLIGKIVDNTVFSLILNVTKHCDVIKQPSNAVL